MNKLWLRIKPRDDCWIPSHCVYCQLLFFWILIPSLLSKTTLQEKLRLKEASVVSLGTSDKESKREKERKNTGRDFWIYIENHYFHTSSCGPAGLLKTNVKRVFCNINPKAQSFVFFVGWYRISVRANGLNVKPGSGARAGGVVRGGSYFERVYGKWWNGADTL